MLDEPGGGNERALEREATADCCGGSARTVRLSSSNTIMDFRQGISPTRFTVLIQGKFAGRGQEWMRCRQLSKVIECTLATEG